MNFVDLRTPAMGRSALNATHPTIKFHSTRSGQRAVLNGPAIELFSKNPERLTWAYDAESSVILLYTTAPRKRITDSRGYAVQYAFNTASVNAGVPLKLIEGIEIGKEYTVWGWNGGVAFSLKEQTTI